MRENIDISCPNLLEMLFNGSIYIVNQSNVCIFYLEIILHCIVISL